MLAARGSSHRRSAGRRVAVSTTAPRDPELTGARWSDTCIWVCVWGAARSRRRTRTTCSNEMRSRRAGRVRSPATRRTRRGMSPRAVTRVTQCITFNRATNHGRTSSPHVGRTTSRSKRTGRTASRTCSNSRRVHNPTGRRRDMYRQCQGVLQRTRQASRSCRARLAAHP